jgi:NAD-dependent SIR2 family protein deacetylase
LQTSLKKILLLIDFDSKLNYNNIRMRNESLTRIFTSEEREENKRRKRDLTKLILSEQALLVVGAGSSAQLGYPTWSKLINELENLAESCGNDFEKNKAEKKENPLKYADHIKSHIKKVEGNPDKFYNKIIKLYSPKNEQPNEFHKNLIKLPFKGYITTNYDCVLEAALHQCEMDSHIDRERNYEYPERTCIIQEDEPIPTSDFLLSLNSKNKKEITVAHLHGYYKSKKSIILSLNDYVESYRLRPESKKNEFKEMSPSWSLHRKFLWAILATRRTVWIGFSMDDPYLNKMLEMVSSDLWRWDESIHYAIMDIKRDINEEKADDIKNKANLLKKRYGVEVVFYEIDNGNHNGLNQIISEIYEEYKLKKQKKEEPQEEDKILLTQDFSSAGAEKSSNWLDTINKRMEDSINANED